MKNRPKITFVIHGKLKTIPTIKKKLTLVFEKDFEVDFLLTMPKIGAKNQVTKAIEEQADYVIIAGGDGSINETINGYMSAPEELRKKVVLGVLPMGTGNDFVKSLKVKNNYEELLELIKQQSFVDVDIAAVQFQNLKNEPDNRYFINIMDIGIGGSVAENLAKSSKLFSANLTYAKAIVSGFLKYKKQYVELSSANYNWKGEILSLCMANGKYFGSGMCIARDASLTDGKIQLTIMGNVSLWDYIKKLSKIKRGEKLAHKEVTYAEVEGCSIQAPKPCPIDMDGEFIGYTPIELKVLPAMVRMIGRK
ncbi:MAG: diacylglycerol kinase family lipid kinase [Aureispira sp.]|nr:diacylglycerol kinase family lipid kinase [Aureispira sp.]